MVLSTTSRRWVIGLLGLIPFLYIVQAVVRVQTGEWNLLGPEPGKTVTHFTGTWAFNFIVATLAVTPIVRLGKQRWLMVHRRMLGLYAFFYVTLHGLAYLWFLLAWQWQDLKTEVIERPYLLLGTIAWFLLVPLALTSSRYWQRRLGRRWKSLHKAIYLIAVLACVHYLLQIRAGWFEPVAYTLLTVALLAMRMSFGSKKTS